MGTNRGIPENKERKSEQIGRKTEQIGTTRGDPLASADPKLGAPTLVWGERACTTTQLGACAPCQCQRPEAELRACPHFASRGTPKAPADGPLHACMQQPGQQGAPSTTPHYFGSEWPGVLPEGILDQWSKMVETV